MLSKIVEANTMIDVLFVEEAAQMGFKLSSKEVALIKDAAELLANNLVKSAAFDFFAGINCKLTLDASDNIKICRTKKMSDTEIIKDK